MRSRVRWMTTIVLGLGWMAGGCEEKDDGISPEVLAAQERARRELEEAAKLPPRPTTQELLAGPQKMLRLANYPLSLRVPQSWNLKSEADGQIFSVGGMASSGQIDIQFTNPGQRVMAQLLDGAVREARKEADAKPHPLNKVELRDLNDGAKVLELRVISNRFENGVLPPERFEEQVLTDSRTGAEVIDPRTGSRATTRTVVNPHLLKWTFTVYIPEGTDRYATRALNFMALSVSEYQRDREFLEKMMSTLKYER